MKFFSYMKNMTAGLWAIFLALAGALSAEPTRLWSHGNPTNEEQHALQVINQIRENPVAAFDRYISQAGLNPVTAKIVADARGYEFSGVPGVPPTTIVGAQALRKTLDAGLVDLGRRLDRRISADVMPPKAPLALYPLFSEQARMQGPALITGGLPLFLAIGPYSSADFFQGSIPAVAGTVVTVPFLVGVTSFAQEAPRLTGPNATGGSAVVKAGVPYESSVPYLRGQSLWTMSFYSTDISMREAFLTNLTNGAMLKSIVTDSFTSGFNFSNQGRTRMIGISIGASRTSPPGIGARQMSVMGTDSEAFETTDLPFGANTVFIVGVVYADTDKNNDYTPGEGLGGQAVKPGTGDWYAVTSSSGGYAIPVQQNAGVVSVSVNLNGVVMTKTVTVGRDSLTLDFVQTEVSKPGQAKVGATDGSNQIVNLSTRGVVERDSAVMVGGFVISGTTPGTKMVLIRGVSNSLLGFGVNGVLRKPLLTLYNSQGSVVKTAKTSDTYTGTTIARNVAVRTELATAFQQVGAFAFTVPWIMTQGDTSLIVNQGLYAQGDTAMVVSLAPGAYTAIISPDPTSSNLAVPSAQNNTIGGSGIALLEVYDMTPDAGGRFVNLATRGKVESGAREMIVGFSIRGSGHRQVLVRGVGPTLRSFGVSGAISDSAVSLFDANSNRLLFNDDWGIATWADQAALVTPQVGAFSMDATSRDGVILAQLTPSNYTMVVSSSSGDAGVALAEVYEH
jgi:hypothetical protein